MSDHSRFDITGYPLPKSAHGKTFFDKTPGLTRFDAPSDSSSTSPASASSPPTPASARPPPSATSAPSCPGPTTTSSTSATPPSRRSTSIAPSPSSSACAPSHRRAQLWSDIKKTLVHLVDERGTAPVVVIDEAQHLSDAFLRDLAGFLNFAFDSRDLLTLWLVGLPPLVKRLHSAQHAALRTRIAAEVHLEPLDRDAFGAAVDHGLKAAGATKKLLTDQAVEMLFRSSRGVLRSASLTLRAAFRIAAERDQAFLDEAVMQAAAEEVGHAT